MFIRLQKQRYLAFLLKKSFKSDQEKDQFRKDVEKIVADTNPRSFHPSMQVNYTGNFITSSEEYNAIVNDLMHVGGWGITGVFAAVFFFFLRFRAVGCMIGTVAISLIWTFGLTRVTIGYLNSSTGFLFSIIAGNGINYSIMYMARYIEDELRKLSESDFEAARERLIEILHNYTFC